MSIPKIQRHFQPVIEQERFFLWTLADKVHKVGCFFIGVGMGAVSSCRLVFASSIKFLPFQAKVASLRSHPGDLGVVAHLKGSAQLYPTGKILFTYQLLVELFIGNCSQGPCGMHVDILFNLLNKKGHILTSFSESYVKGSHNPFCKTYDLDEKIISQTHKINVSIRLTD